MSDEEKADELAELRSTRARRDDAHAIHFHHGRGMSRRRLAEIYGADLVNMILGTIRPSTIGGGAL